MKRKKVVLGLALLLLVVLSSTVGVMADKGGDPHDHHNGGCVAYCARATQGESEFCLRDLCGHKYGILCRHERCSGDVCELKQGPDTHGRGLGKP